MEFKDFYDIAEYGNTAWKGSFTPREIAENAYDYLCEFEASKKSGSPTVIIKELANLLFHDGTEEALSWLYQISTELGTLHMEFQDYMYFMKMLKV